MLKSELDIHSSVGCTIVLGADLKTINADEGAENTENSSSVRNALPESLNGTTGAGLSDTKGSPTSKNEG